MATERSGPEIQDVPFAQSTPRRCYRMDHLDTWQYTRVTQEHNRSYAQEVYLVILTSDMNENIFGAMHKCYIMHG